MQKTVDIYKGYYYAFVDQKPRKMKPQGSI